MGAFIVYVIKCAVCLAFFYLFNKLLLEKETFHKANRWAWLLIIPSSLIIPPYHLEVWELLKNTPEAITNSNINFSNIPIVDDITGESADSIRIYYVVKALIYIYFAGVIFFALLYLNTYIRLFTLIIKGKRLKLNLEEHKKSIGINRKVYIIMQRKRALPFSWMNYIFITEEDLQENGAEIIRHELSHIKNLHSYDVMIADTLILFQWFNPAAWLLKRSLQQVHEFQADEDVILSGTNAKSYQLLLIKKAVGQRVFSISNSFNHGKLKNRINMMLKEKSSKWAYTKFLYVFPLAFAVVSAYAAPTISLKLNEVKDIMHNNMVLSNDTIKKVLPDTFKVYAKAYYLTNDSKEQDSTKQKPNDDNIMNVSVKQDSTKQGVIIVSTKTKESGSKVIPESVLYIVDDKEIENRDIATINPNDIKSISVLKDYTAIKHYGDKGKNGVIIITTKNKKAKTKL